MAKGKGKVFARNKKANYDFAIEETIEAGIVFKEQKSNRSVPEKSN